MEGLTSVAILGTSKAVAAASRLLLKESTSVGIIQVVEIGKEAYHLQENVSITSTTRENTKEQALGTEYFNDVSETP
eukprot:scaffold1588_cov214-Alexandrium_tamarense.AAC.8